MTTNAAIAMQRPFPVPIRVTGGPDTTLPEEVATFFWVDGSGEIVKTLESVPIQNGVALYSGEPLPQGARWAITVHDAGGLPIFRSGPLAELPGPASEIVLGSRISVFRVSVGANFGIDSPDGASELVRQRLNLLPAALRLDSVKFAADSAGREIVEVTGKLRFFVFFSVSFTYSLSLTLQPVSQPGHPEEIILVEAAGPGSGSGANLGSLAAVLDQAIVEGVSNALNAAVKQIAEGQLALFGANFPASLVSATHIEAIPILSDPQISVVVHGGTITGSTVVFESEQERSIRFMSIYIARIEFKGEPTKASYDALHAVMAGMGFLRTMATNAGYKELPHATYCNMLSTEAMGVVAKRINVAACNIQRACNVIVIASEDSYTWNNV